MDDIRIALMIATLLACMMPLLTLKPYAKPVRIEREERERY